jgi:hypothetical protein
MRKALMTSGSLLGGNKKVNCPKLELWQGHLLIYPLPSLFLICFSNFLIILL